MKGNNGLRQAGTRQGLTGGSAGEVIIYTYYIHTKRRGLSTSLYSYFDVIAYATTTVVLFITTSTITFTTALDVLCLTDNSINIFTFALCLSVGTLGPLLLTVHSEQNQFQYRQTLICKTESANSIFRRNCNV